MPKEEIFKNLIEALEIRGDSRRLDLGRIFCAKKEKKKFSLLSPGQLKSVVDTLRYSNCFFELLLREFPLFDKGMQSLERLVALNRHIVCIFLDDCRFKRDGVVALARALEKRTNLSALSISRNKFGNGGVKSLCRRLGECKVQYEQCSWRVKEIFLTLIATSTD